MMKFKLSYLLFLLMAGIISFECASAPLNVSCSGAPAGFSVALIGDAGQYAQSDARISCKDKCEKISDSRVKTKEALVPGQSFSFVNKNVSGFGARGTVAAELCKDGKIYNGDQAVEVTYALNGVIKSMQVKGAIAMPSFQFTTQGNESTWQFQVISIK